MPDVIVPTTATAPTTVGSRPVANDSTSVASRTPDAGVLSSWYRDYMNAGTNQSDIAATPASWTPDDRSTVQGQLKGILDAGGPLMDRATTRALQQMNARGVLNSSMAIGAGQAALYDAAVPIAGADASTYARSQSENAQMRQDAATQAAGFQQQSNLQAADLAGQERLQAAGFQQQSRVQAADIASQERLQSKDLASRYDLANLDANTRKQLQAADAENQQKLQAADQVFRANLQTQSLGVQQSMQQYQLAVQQAMNGQDNQTKLAVATLDANTQTMLADINNKYKVQIQTSASMSNTFSQLTASIAQVMADPNMDADAKNISIKHLTDLYQTNMDMQSNLTGLDLGKLLIPDVDDTKKSQDGNGTDLFGGGSGNSGGIGDIGNGGNGPGPVVGNGP